MKPPPPARPRRDLLKQYYQQHSADKSDASSPSSSQEAGTFKRADPLDIGSLDSVLICSDTTAYHPDLAFNKLVKEQALADLISNHNSLVAATALDMDQQVLAVDEKMNQITNSLQIISDTLTPKRSKIEHLSGIDSLVNKVAADCTNPQLNFIIDMPQNLSEYLETKKYAEAVLFYSKASALLSHYQGVPMFKQIDQECNDMIKHIGIKVQNRVFSGIGSITQISEGIGMLVALQTLPASDLAKQFIYK
ncbi:Vacuolar protein sorting-associated protein 51 [Kappamyces sp. JEL0680]|nr:Vacuolar protein sorting-associated protein 51 [Kappamyces sp. JEL0680]